MLLSIESPQYEQRIDGWIVRRGDALAFELLYVLICFASLLFAWPGLGASSL